MWVRLYLRLSLPAVVAAVGWATAPPADRPPGFCLGSSGVHRLARGRRSSCVSPPRGTCGVLQPRPALGSAAVSSHPKLTVGPPGSLLPLGDGANWERTAGRNQARASEHD